MLTSLVLTVLAASPPLPLTLRIEPSPDESSPTQVVFRLKNDGEAPLRVVHHRGLLSLEVRVPERRAPVRCSAPAGTRPGGVDPERIVDLAPGASAAEVVDVRWYCWSSRAAKALASPGATIVGRYGFGRRRATARSWVVSSLDGATRMASLEAEPIGLAASSPAAGPEASGLVELSLAAAPARLDSADGRLVPIVLRLRNEAPDDTRVLVHPAMFSFVVRGPRLVERCALPVAQRSPMRESFTRLRPRGRATQTLDLAAVCPERTFAAPGVYDVETIFESEDDGGALGLRAFAGSVTGGRAVVRVTSGDLPAYETLEPPR